MRLRLSFFLVILIVLYTVAVSGQRDDNSDSRNDRKQSLRFKAPRTEYEFNGNSFVKSYSGGVKAWQEDVELEADKAFYISDVSEARFYGNATLKDSIRQLSADTLIYFYKSSVAYAIGDVKVIEKDRLFRSERLKYYKDMRIIEAVGSIYLHDDSLRSTITGAEAVFNDSTGNGVITGSPVLVREDNEGSIITITCSDTLEIEKEQKIVRLWENVIMIRDSLRVSSGYAVYDDNIEVVILTGTPVARHVIHHEPDDAVSDVMTVSTVTGDSMRVNLSERRVSGVDVIGAAHSTTVSTDTTGSLYEESIITSAAIHIVMKENLVSLITAEGTANGYYHKVVQDDDRMFVNEASGDTIYFFFDEGRISQMRITGAGGAGARGKYYEFIPKTVTASQDSLKKDKNQN